MAGQPDAADDLIAELAKLMAQDANSDRPVAASTPSFTVRIPGGDTPPAASPVAASQPAAPQPVAPQPVPVPRFDFDRKPDLPAGSLTPKPADRPAHAVSTPAITASPAAPTPAAAPDAVAPFHFDFDLGNRPRTPEPAAPSLSATPTAQPQAPALSTVSTVDHDSIADLIAAELSADPAPPRTQPAPAEPVVAAHSAPQAAPRWAPAAQPSTPAAPAQPSVSAEHPRDAGQGDNEGQDQFKVPPVFGLGSRPASVEPTARPVAPQPAAPVAAEPAPVPRQPAPVVPAAPVIQPPAAPAADDDGLGRDPIDEIEHLIGRAMRVEFEEPDADDEVEQRPAPSPALRSLATPTFTPAERQPAPRTLSGADEAILAAAEATGAEIGWVEAPAAEQAAPVKPAARRRLPRPTGLARAFAGPLVAVTLLLAAGFGLYWVLGLGRDSGPAPLLTADTSPIKETPEAPAETAATQQSVVFNEINGVVPGAEEQLVSRDQADVNEVTQVPPTTGLSEEGLANRKVRTVTVRPDGTIVSGDDSVAGSAILPVARPNVPAVPGADTAIPELIASAEAEPATPATTTPEPTPVPAATAAAPVTPVTPGTMVPAVDAAGNPLGGRTAPVPLTRPAGLAQSTAPTAAVNAVVDTPATGNLLPPPPANSTLGATPASAPATATATQPAAAIPGAVEVDALPNSAPAYAQLASLRSEEEARQAAQSLVNRFGPLFGGANMEVQRVDLGARGIYYRVRVPAASAQAANSICANVRAAGGDCVLM